MAQPNLRAYLGQEVAHYRRKKGLTQAELAKEVNYSDNTIQAVEQGTRSPSDDLCCRLDGVFNLDGVLRRLGKQVRSDPSPWGSYREFEQEAATIRVFTNILVPGMLQVPGYARTVIAAVSPDADVEAEVADRLARQERLYGENPPHLHVIIAESVLDQAFGGPEVWKEQLERLLNPGPTVSVRILPTSDRAHPGLRGPIIIVDLPDGDQVAFADSQGPGGLMDQPEHLARCERAWEWINVHALPVDLSAEWIEGLLRELE